jgi:hypothetical protein
MSPKKRLIRQARPFATTAAAHAIVRVAEAMDWDIQDAEAFLKRVQHIEYGLSAEMEFATILRWLGICKFVHRISDDLLADDAFTDFKIPDLLAFFRHDHFESSAVVEVKTSEAPSLSFSKDYLHGLTRYAAHIGKPLLVA